MNARVFLVGGAPGAGKTTLSCALAAKIGGSSVTIDDIVTIAKTAITPESHPGLYLIKNMSYLDYFTNSSLEQMKADAERQAEAVWPFVKNLITKHFNWTTTPIVIDGWHLRPHRIAELGAETIDSNWIYISPKVLEERERRNVDFLQGSSDPERMFQNFMSRSLWFNDLLNQQAAEFGMTILNQAGETSVDELCEMILKKA